MLLLMLPSDPEPDPLSTSLRSAPARKLHDLSGLSVQPHVEYVGSGECMT